MEDKEISKEQQKQAILEKINCELEKLGSTTKWLKIPEGLEGNKILEGKIIVMVDDVKEVLEALAPALTVVTEGKANFVHYTGQELKQLLDEIMAYNPDIILLDYHLPLPDQPKEIKSDIPNGIKGTEVLKALQEAGFAGKTIGFTSDENASIEFMGKGASGCVKKNAGWPEKSIKELTALLSEKD
jgi:CheY-like chemotaxis protein